METLQDLSRSWDVSTNLNLTQSLPTKTHLRFEPQQVSMSPILHFLDHPFQTWQSSVLFAIIITCLITVSAFMAKRYLEALRLHHWDPTIPPTLERLRPLRFPSETQKSAATVTGSAPRSQPRIQFSIPIIAVGEVYHSKLAQRRRASSGLGDQSTGGSVTENSPQN